MEPLLSSEQYLALHRRWYTDDSIEHTLLDVLLGMIAQFSDLLHYLENILCRPTVRGVSWSDVTTVPKRKSHRGLDLDLSLNAEVNIWKGWKENGGTK